jgi:hypothetical protein
MYNGRGGSQTMRALGEQLLSLAQRLEDPDLLLEAHHALWTSLFSGGDLIGARMHQEQGLRLYDPQRHRAQAGQPAQGLEAVTWALATIARSAGRWWEAELHRLRGELLLQHAVAPPGEAEACFQQALDIARHQQAKSLELRTAVSLSRFWQQQG